MTVKVSRSKVRLFLKLRRAAWAAFEHDVLGTSKAAAYSAIFFLFPTILVFTALLTLTQAPASLRADLRFFSNFLPEQTTALLRSAVHTASAHSAEAILASSLIAFWAAMGFILSLLEGFRRAYGLSRRAWSFWEERLIAVILIPSCLLPLIAATAVVAFGRQMELWAMANAGHVLGHYVLLAWRLTRWAIGLVTTICVLAVIYRFGTPEQRAWRHVLPGAAGAAILWVSSTLLYGVYIARFSNYSLVYGSVATVIATLVWLYLASFVVLMGSEFNAQLYPREGPRHAL